MSRNIPITVSLSTDLLDKLDKYKNRSLFIRQAIEEKLKNE